MDQFTHKNPCYQILISKGGEEKNKTNNHHPVMQI